MSTDTTYLGLRLAHPYIAGASPFGYRLDSLKRLEDAGCAAVVLHSLFEEQITHALLGRTRNIDPTDPAGASALAHFPDAADYPLTPDAYAEHVRSAKRALGIPVIASINGNSPESWLKCSRVLEQAGADALEVNVYDVVTDPAVPAAAVEMQLAAVVRNLKSLVRIPVAVKLTPFFTAFGNVARQMERAGADGLVLFNRFYQPDIDIRTMTTTPRLQLSRSAELTLRLRWTAVLHGRIRPSLAVSGGVETPEDGIKAILAGADAVQLVSALLRHGPTHMDAMRQGLARWMKWQEIDTLDDVRGRVSLKDAADPSSVERGGYIHSLHSWDR